MSKPSIVFVPGSYVLLSVYRPILDALSNKGYETVRVQLPTIGLSRRQGRAGPAPSMYDDAEVIARELKRLSDQGKNIVLGGHSYAGVPMSQSTKGLDKRARDAQGKPGGVVRLAYMAALVPPERGSAASLLGRFPEDKRPSVAVDENGWMSMEDPAGTASMICQDLPLDEGEKVVKGFAKHSARSFGDELTHAGYKDIPVSYLLAENDMAGPPDFQRDMIATIEEASGSKVDITPIAAGHMMNLSAEKETIEWIQQVCDKSLIGADAS